MAVYAWSLTAANNSTADPSINWQEGQLPSTVNNSARAMMAALKAGFNDIAGVSALAGSGNTFTLALSQALPSLTNAVVGFFATRNNTGAVTLNVDSLGAKPLRFVSGTDLTSGQIVDGGFYICAYNVADQEWIIVGNAAVIANAQLATMATSTVKANVSGSTAVPSDVTIDTLLSNASAGAISGLKLTDLTITYGKLNSSAVADAAAYRAKTASKFLTADVWDAAATVALTYGATIALDLSTGINFTLTLTGPATISNPTNPKVGQSGFIKVTQDATGGRVLSLGSNFKWVDGTAAAGDTTASRINVYTYVVLSSTEIWVTLARGVR